MSDTPKKIIIDEDWKQEAQHEKENLEADLEAQLANWDVGHGEAGLLPG